MGLLDFAGSGVVHMVVRRGAEAAACAVPPPPPPPRAAGSTVPFLPPPHVHRCPYSTRGTRRRRVGAAAGAACVPVRAAVGSGSSVGREGIGT